ncbi:MAG: hypothetical protein LBF25_00245 [Puniceicoccales bacterium]|jgi:hypothetical protein|nr:hypothetical protein [Puniceicoccales bacterium]
MKNVIADMGHDACAVISGAIGGALAAVITGIHVTNGIAIGAIGGAIGEVAGSKVGRVPGLILGYVGGVVIRSVASGIHYITGIGAGASMIILFAIPVAAMAAKALSERIANVRRKQPGVPRFDVLTRAPWRHRKYSLL